MLDDVQEWRTRLAACMRREVIRRLSAPVEDMAWEASQRWANRFRTNMDSISELDYERMDITGTTIESMLIPGAPPAEGERK